MKPIDLLKHRFQNRHYFIHACYKWRRLSRDNFQSLVWKASRKLLSIILGISLLPLSLILHLAGFRRVTVFTERIGHLAIEPDCLLKEQMLGLIPKQKWIILAPPGRVANEHLLRYWEPFFLIFRGRIICFVLESMSQWGIMRYSISRYTLAISNAQASYRIQAQWGDRAPLLALAKPDEEWGIQALRQMGLPEGAWFACVHAREAGFSPIDEELHAHRNSSIEATVPAIREITQRGGWVIRIGDPSMKPLSPLPQVIDYAHHPIKCERLDMILCAKARFILGNTSGIALVGTVFGVPCALANMIPFPALGLGPKDISIPKLLWSETLSRYLSYKEILDAPISCYMYARLYRESKIRVEENSAEDIRRLALEMIQRLENPSQNNFNTEQQSIPVNQILKPHHYGYGGISTISSYFVQHHKGLFEDLMLSRDTLPHRGGAESP